MKLHSRQNEKKKLECHHLNNGNSIMSGTSLDTEKKSPMFHVVFLLIHHHSDYALFTALVRPTGVQFSVADYMVVAA